MLILMVTKWTCSTSVGFVDPITIFWFLLSIPQSEETRAELSQIAWVPRQVCWSFLISQIHLAHLWERSFLPKPINQSWALCRTRLVGSESSPSMIVSWTGIKSRTSYFGCLSGPEWDGSIPTSSWSLYGQGSKSLVWPSPMVSTSIGSLIRSCSIPCLTMAS